MSGDEVCVKFGISKSSLETNFKRTQESILRQYGYKLRKTKVEGVINYTVIEDDGRAPLMVAEGEDKKSLDSAALNCIDFDFLVLLGVIMTPMQVFRGSYKEFLEYVEVKVDKNNIEKLKESLEKLSRDLFITYAIDKTDSDYFIAGLSRKAETKLQLNVRMVKRCKSIMKKDWISLFKCWLGTLVLYDYQPYSVKALCDVTGLSKYKVEKCLKALEKENLIKKEKATAGYDLCLGQMVEPNAIYL